MNLSFHFLAPEAPIAQLIVRSTIVYFLLLIALRVAGRREMGQMTSFDYATLGVSHRGPLSLLNRKYE